MSLLHLFLLAIVQGMTEFLPISSSGHLILLPHLLGTEDQGQIVDVAVHLGTLGAVMWYLRHDVRLAASGVPDLLRGRLDSRGARLAMLLVAATVPVILFGLLLKVMGWDDLLRSTAVIGWAMLIFGLMLYWFDRNTSQKRTIEHWSMKHALIMGLGQAVALIPGTSRAGIVITAARALGYAREDAARLSMLMSIPAIIASGTVIGIEVAATADAAAARDGAIAAALAFAAALLALTVMMRLLKFISFTPYVIYRVFLGAILLWVAYT